MKLTIDAGKELVLLKKLRKLSSDCGLDLENTLSYNNWPGLLAMVWDNNGYHIIYLCTVLPEPTFISVNIFKWLVKRKFNKITIEKKGRCKAKMFACKIMF